MLLVCGVQRPAGADRGPGDRARYAAGAVNTHASPGSMTCEHIVLINNSSGDGRTLQIALCMLHVSMLY